MRLTEGVRTFIKNRCLELFPGTEVYLFGSRIYDSARGGDIDILLLSDEKLSPQSIRRFRVEFFKKFGWQKIDLVNFTFTEKSSFKELALIDAELL